MASKKQLGIFWGLEFLSIAEMQRDQLSFSAVIPRQIIENLNQPAKNDLPVSPENIHLTAAIQRLLRDQDIQNPKIRLSIPVRDVIFRSFVLPMMSPAETENAIIFEAPRYIPFKLDKIFYNYHAISFTDGNVKKNQILFLAIERDKLDQYSKIIEEAGAELLSAEPAIIGLLRILQAKKLLTLNQTIAIIQANDANGSLMIADQQLPQFIRDFNFFSSSTNSSEKDFRSTLTRLINEIRISLDFYNRQAKTTHQQNQVKQIYVFASQNSREISQGLQDDLGIETIPLEINDLFPYENQLHPNMANAIGASLADSISLGFDLDLAKSRKTTHSSKPGVGVESFLAQAPNYKITAAIAGICFLIIGASFGITHLQNAPQQKRLAELTAIDKKYAKNSSVDLSKSAENIKAKIATYQKLYLKSHMTTYLKNISQSLVDGIWLKDLEIINKDAALSQGYNQQENETKEARVQFTITGYSYSEQLNQQISFIEGFLKKIKLNSFFKKHAKKIELTQVKKDELDGFPITFFQISMETDETND
ncbi:MAG: pilus assembly protein PilM [Candidatus Omnitrophota bacterium]